MKVYADLRGLPEDLVITAIESGCDGVILQESRKVPVLIKVLINEDYKRDFYEVDITPDRQDEVSQKILEGKNVVIMSNPLDVLSLENLVARNNSFYASLINPDEVETAKTIMERGVHGLILRPKDKEELIRAVSAAKKNCERVELKKATISEISFGGYGDRVCVDTISLMVPGQGVLVGNTTAGYFLVNAESVENDYTGKRPFRVNAGAVHGYILQPNNKTQYLSELKIGDSVLVSNHIGKSLESRVGRIKIESRPFILVKAQYEDKEISVYMQNGSQVHLVSPGGTPIPITSLKKGDLVLADIRGVEGRHMGIKYEEKIIEK